jgi:hypothetical protein
MGIRYLLPSFPFLILMGAFLAEHLWNWRPSWGIHGGKLLVSGLLMFHCESALAQSPHFMSYFNELVPSERKVFFLGDSNLDMGQDVKRLAETAKQRGWGTVKLALFGGAVDPSVYGMKWNYWTKKDLAGPQPGQVYAVNMFLLQLGPIFVPSLKSIAESWVISTPPTGRVGDSWIFFEIPGKAAPDPSTPIPSVSVF